MQFYKKIGITRDVGSRPDYNAYGLRPLLSTKYFFDSDRDNKDKSQDTSFVGEDGKTKMPCWKLVKNCNHFDIYENECYIPMGFSFDKYVTEEEFDRISNVNKPQALLYAMVLTREQMERNADITGYDAEKYAQLYGDEPSRFRSAVDNYSYGENQYKVACQTLIQHSCRHFAYTDDGFEATYDNRGGDTLVFFSVPFSEGFSATVNDVPVGIERADFGFMAVRVPAGTDSLIRFTYETPGLRTGAMLSFGALAAFAVYLAAAIIIRKIRR